LFKIKINNTAFALGIFSVACVFPQEISGKLETQQKNNQIAAQIS